MRVKFNSKKDSVSKLYQEHKSSALFPVWLALNNLAEKAGSRMITPTHKDISEISGVAVGNSISRVLTVLEDAGWIKRFFLRGNTVEGWKTAMKISIKAPLGGFKTKSPKAKVEENKPHLIGLEAQGQAPEIDLKKRMVAWIPKFETYQDKLEAFERSDVKDEGDKVTIFVTSQKDKEMLARSSDLFCGINGYTEFTVKLKE
jgi:hypothetical protein